MVVQRAVLGWRGVSYRAGLYVVEREIMTEICVLETEVDVRDRRGLGGEFSTLF